MKKRNKKVRLKGEKFVSILIVLAIIAFPIATVPTKAILSETNIALEKMKGEIKNQEEVNESLSMQVDELASLDKIEEVATSKGLSYNNRNIKSIHE